jgi:hypothetical protein
MRFTVDFIPVPLDRVVIAVGVLLVAAVVLRDSVAIVFVVPLLFVVVVLAIVYEAIRDSRGSDT